MNVLFLLERRHRVEIAARVRGNWPQDFDKSHAHTHENKKLTLDQDDTVMQLLHLAEASDPCRVSFSRLNATVRYRAPTAGRSLSSSATCLRPRSTIDRHTRRKTLSRFAPENRCCVYSRNDFFSHGSAARRKITAHTWSRGRPRA